MRYFKPPRFPQDSGKGHADGVCSLDGERGDVIINHGAAFRLLAKRLATEKTMAMNEHPREVL